MQINSIGFQQSMKNSPNFNGIFKLVKSKHNATDSTECVYVDEYYKYFPYKNETKKAIKRTVDTFIKENSIKRSDKYLDTVFTDVIRVHCDIQKTLPVTKQEAELLRYIL